MFSNGDRHASLTLDQLKEAVVGGVQDNPTKKQKFKGGSFNGAKADEPAFRFINVGMDKADAAELEALLTTGELGIDLLFGLVDDGYKCTFSRDKEHKRYTASITDKSDNSAWHNACITGSGKSALDAWHAVAFKHFVKASQDWANLSADSDAKYT